MKTLFSICWLCLFALIGTIAPHALAVPFLSFSTTSGPDAYVGETFNIGINVNDIADLYAYNLSFLYTPTAVRFVSMTEGNFLSSAGSTFFIPGTVDEAASMISFTGESLLGDISGASGGGTLFTLTFTTLPVLDGTLATFSMADSLFLDSTFTDIVVSSAESLGVRILDPSSGTVSEPSVPMLLLSGAAALALTRTKAKGRVLDRLQLA